MTDWLALCRAAVGDVQGVLAELPFRVDREPVLGMGKGGDETTAIDAAAEAAALTPFRGIDDVTIVSEEVGIVGSGAAVHVIVDPIDGSVNAKRGIRFFSISIAIASGPKMVDVDFGFVHDFGTGEEWTAVRAGAFVELADRLRIMGSLALSLCHLAAGRVDAVCSLKPARSVDIAAAQLLVRERGLAIELPGDPPFAEARLDLEGRSRVVAAGTPHACRQLAAALSA